MVRARDRSLHSEVKYYKYLKIIFELYSFIRIGLPNSFPELFGCDTDKTQLDTEDEEKSKLQLIAVCMKSLKCF